jgi:hypothetical protein
MRNVFVDVPKGQRQMVAAIMRAGFAQATEARPDDSGAQSPIRSESASRRSVRSWVRPKPTCSRT